MTRLSQLFGTPRCHLLSSIVFATSNAAAIDGVVPPEPGTPNYIPFNMETMESVCGWGKVERLSSLHGNPAEFNNTTCGAILVAPNIVLTARHCFGPGPLSGVFSNVAGQAVSCVDEFGVPVDTPGMWYDFAAGVPRYVVRFRLTPNGTVGSHQQGESSYYQVPVKRIVFPSDQECADMGRVADIVLLVLADGENDLDGGGIWSDGYIDHITPSPILPTIYRSSIPFAGTAVAWGPHPGTPTPPDTSANGVMRISQVPDLFFGDSNMTNDVAGINNYPDVIPGDSGGSTFMMTEQGAFLAGWGLSGGLSDAPCVLSPGNNAAFFQSHASVFGAPQLAAVSPLDVTGSAAPSVHYDGPDWTINLDDVISIAAFNSALTEADWNGDGSLNTLDLDQFTSELMSLLNPYASNPLFPLPVGSSDPHRDQRFNSLDIKALTALIGSTSSDDLIHDYDGDGVIDMDDVNALKRVYNTVYPGTSARVFDHGIFGDVSGDGVADCTDFGQTTLLAFDGTERADFPTSGYSVALDVNLNQILDGDDQRALTSKLLPGDITTQYSLGSGGDLIFVNSGTNPDSWLGLYDARTFLRKLVTDLNPAGLANPFTDVVGDGWTPGTAYTEPDGQVTLPDAVYAFTTWTAPCNGTVQTDALLDFWFMDINADGRMNIQDIRELQSFVDANPGFYTPEWDMNSNGTLETSDYVSLFSVMHIASPFGHGVLGDFDGSASPTCIATCGPRPGQVSFTYCEDVNTNPCGEPVVVPLAGCSDLIAMRDTHTGGLDDLFGSGHEFGNAGFVVQLDANLDGLLDQTDREVVLLHLQRADFTLDGFVDNDDASAFTAAFLAGDPLADMNDDEIFDASDVVLFSTAAGEACN